MKLRSAFISPHFNGQMKNFVTKNAKHPPLKITTDAFLDASVMGQ
jgi:hypothetical protein